MRITLGGREMEARLDAQPMAATGIVLLPGASGDIFNTRYEERAIALRESGFMVLRYESWRGPAELDRLTLRQLDRELADATLYLRKMGCRQVGIVAKSFGCALALLRDDVEWLVLHAPAVSVGDANIAQLWDVPLGNIKDPLDIRIEPRPQCPTLIIHGTADETVPLENAEALAERIEGDLHVIQGGTHHFNEHEGEVTMLTVEFCTRAVSGPARH